MFEFIQDGKVTMCRDGRDLLKACGAISETGKSIIMTDESGQLVGAGIDDCSLLKSIPMIKEIRETPLYKPKPQAQKPLLKAMTSPARSGSYHDRIKANIQAMERILA